MRKGPLSKLIIAAVFIVLEIAAISVLRKNSRFQDDWIHRASLRTVAFFSGSAETVRGYFSLEAVNRDLNMENERLQAELQRYRNEASEREEERFSLLVESGKFHRIPAKVVKIGRNTGHNYIILNKGEQDGVLPNSGIVSSKGVVGIVMSVGKHYSYGFPLNNPLIKIGAKVGRDGIAAPLSWDGLHSDMGVLSDLPPKFEASPADTVYTSGYSLMFPAGIPLGIPGKGKIVNGSTLEVSVHLFQDFKALRYVTVLVNPDAGEIESLEEEQL